MIPENMQIGVDREEDKRRFHVTSKRNLFVTADKQGKKNNHIRKFY